MTQAQTFTGTGEELQGILSRHLNEKNMILIIPADERPKIRPPKMSQEEILAFLSVRDDRNNDLPVLPDEAFDRENIY